MALPPGPCSFPFIGPLGISKSGYDSFIEWSRQTGSDIVGFHIPGTSTSVAVLNSYAAFRDTLGNANLSEDLNGRPHRQVDEMLNPKRIGLAFPEGERWKLQSSFVWKHVPVVPMTDLLHDALKDLVTALGDSGDQGLPIDPKEPIKRAVGAAYYALFFGESPHGHPEFAELTDYYADRVMNFYKQGPFVLQFAKTLSLLPFDCWHVKWMVEERSRCKHFFREKIQAHKQALDASSPRGFLDLYLLEQKKREGEQVNSGGNANFSDDELVEVLDDLFLGGQVPLVGTLLWCFLLMAYHVDVQDRVRKEILDVTGRERVPSWSDKERLLYTTAALREVQRFACITVFGLGNSALQDVQVRTGRPGRELLLPKGTTVITNIYAVMHESIEDHELYRVGHKKAEDEDSEKRKLLVDEADGWCGWPAPESFDPDANFLRNGKPAPESIRHSLPFGIGPRRCPAQGFAWDFLFTMFGGAMQRLRVEAAHAEAGLLPSEKEHEMMGASRFPKQYKVLFKKV